MILISLHCNKKKKKPKWLCKCTPGFGYKILNIAHLEALHNNLFKNMTNMLCLKALALVSGEWSCCSGPSAEGQPTECWVAQTLHSLCLSPRFCQRCSRFGRRKDFSANHCFFYGYRSHNIKGTTLKQSMRKPQQSRFLEFRSPQRHMLCVFTQPRILRHPQAQDQLPERCRSQWHVSLGKRRTRGHSTRGASLAVQ